MSGIQWWKPEGFSPVPPEYFSSKQYIDNIGRYYGFPVNYTSNIYEWEPAGVYHLKREKKEGDYQEATFFDPFGSLNDNSTQGKSRRGFFRSSSKDDDYLIGKKGWGSLPQGKDDDYLQGGKGRDKLRGGKGDDYLIGGDGNDYLKGGKGHDVLIGGAGKNKLKGGKGADIFDVKSGTEKGSKCIIKDFNPNEGDKISAGDKVSIEMKGDKAIIEADGATTILRLGRLDSDYRPKNAPVFRDWFTDPTSTIVDVVES